MATGHGLDPRSNEIRGDQASQRGNWPVTITVAGVGLLALLASRALLTLSFGYYGYRDPYWFRCGSVLARNGTATGDTASCSSDLRGMSLIAGGLAATGACLVVAALAYRRRRWLPRDRVRVAAVASLVIAGVLAIPASLWLGSQGTTADQHEATDEFCNPTLDFMFGHRAACSGPELVASSITFGLLGAGAACLIAGLLLALPKGKMWWLAPSVGGFVWVCGWAYWFVTFSNQTSS